MHKLSIMQKALQLQNMCHDLFLKVLVIAAPIRNLDCIDVDLLICLLVKAPERTKLQDLQGDVKVLMTLWNFEMGYRCTIF